MTIEQSFEAASHVLWFHSRISESRSLAFPCDAAGHVDLDALSERMRDNYLFARKAVGREFDVPTVQAIAAERLRRSGQDGPTGLATIR